MHAALTVLGYLLAGLALVYLARILVNAVGMLLPQYDCYERGHKDVFYGCTSCGTPYAHKDKWNRPCCWVPEYHDICGVCHMKVYTST